MMRVIIISQSGGYQYEGYSRHLEEDCDYGVFYKAMLKISKTIDITEKCSRHNDSIVRTYKGFTK